MLAACELTVGISLRSVVDDVVCRLDGHVDLSERLIECQYELTDGLAYYLCSRRPGELIRHTCCRVIGRSDVSWVNICAC